MWRGLQCARSPACSNRRFSAGGRQRNRKVKGLSPKINPPPQNVRSHIFHDRTRAACKPRHTIWPQIRMLRPQQDRENAPQVHCARPQSRQNTKPAPGAGSAPATCRRPPDDGGPLRSHVSSSQFRRSGAVAITHLHVFHRPLFRVGARRSSLACGGRARAIPLGSGLAARAADRGKRRQAAKNYPPPARRFPPPACAPPTRPPTEATRVQVATRGHAHHGHRRQQTSTFAKPRADPK